MIDQLTSVKLITSSARKAAVRMSVDFLDEAQVARLPRRARLAFGVRCARRTLPLLLAWAKGRFQFVQPVEQLIAFYEKAARDAPCVERGKVAANPGQEVESVRTAVGDAIKAIISEHQDALLSDEAQRKGLRAAAAAGEAVDSLGFCYVTIFHAVRSGKELGIDIGPDVKRDYDGLAKRAWEDRWTDETPVPDDVFGPMWPEGAPAELVP